jgi:hypothetical protein
VNKYTFLLALNEYEIINKLHVINNIFASDEWNTAQDIGPIFRTPKKEYFK